MRAGVVAALIAAAVSGPVSLVTLIATGRRTRVDRQRQAFAEAFRSVAAYREYPYIVRRRRDDDEEHADRLRITSALSNVQTDLHAHTAVLEVEAPRVARAYVELVGATRRVAGSEIKRSWGMPAIPIDQEPSIEGIDLRAVEPYEHAFLTACADHVSVLPWRLRAAGRLSRQTAGRLVRYLFVREGSDDV